jgi:type IV secretion system protein VirB9
MRRVLGGLLLLVAAAPALAYRPTDEAAAGGRIRYVDYDPDEVVTIEAVVGVVTHIVLDPTEKYVVHAFGDGKAWDFAYRQNHLFLKPAALDADTNLTVVTDRHSYHFALKLRTEKGAVPTYEIAFRYREPKARRVREAEAREIDESFQKPAANANLRYSMSGDEDIAPRNCWDDGEFTHFKFAGGTDLPAIYMVDPDGAESVVDRHTTGPANEIVVVHKVARRWVLRLGQRALAVWNDAYSTEGRLNDTGTAAPDVKRVLWK